mgnify:CR=1 FL=1
MKTHMIPTVGVALMTTLVACAAEPEREEQESTESAWTRPCLLGGDCPKTVTPSPALLACEQECRDNTPAGKTLAPVRMTAYPRRSSSGSVGRRTRAV